MHLQVSTLRVPPFAHILPLQSEMKVDVSVRQYVCVRACVLACVRACVRVRVCVYDCDCVCISEGARMSVDRQQGTVSPSYYSLLTTLYCSLLTDIRGQYHRHTTLC